MRRPVRVVSYLATVLSKRRGGGVRLRGRGCAETSRAGSREQDRGTEGQRDVNRRRCQSLLVSPGFSWLAFL